MRISLDDRVRDQVERAKESPSGRSAESVYGGHDNVLRQTLVALRAGASLAEHESPGEATLLVLRGRVRLNSGDTSSEGTTGDLLVVPSARHSLDAVRTPPSC